MTSTAGNPARIAWLITLLLTLPAAAQELTAQASLVRPVANPVPRNGGVRPAIGLTRLERQLGKQTPTGLGVVVSHVEGNQGDYLPAINTSHFAGVAFEPISGPSIVNAHAQATARVIYGRNGLAPGVHRVNAYSSYHWVRSGLLRTGTPEAPLSDDSRVVTHSWVGGGDDAFTREALRRVDWAIDTHGLIMIAGVNNGMETRVPGLICSAYNAIAVGNWIGNSSGNYTVVDVVGRCKPDLVAPNGQTSFATPTVAAVVCRLLEWTDRMDDERAGRPEVIKAVLMAGAEKPENWSRDERRPLDHRFGAGRLRADRAHAILNAPAAQPTPALVRHTMAWDWRDIPARDEQPSELAYEFEAGQPMGELSAVLTWHRRIDGRVLQDILTSEPRWVDTPRSAELSLSLVRLESDASQTVLDQSASRIDNVQHVYVKNLPAGRWRLVVQRTDRLDEAWDFALAWRIEPHTPPNAPRR